MDFNPQNVKRFGFSQHKMRKLCRQRIRHGFCDYEVWDISYYLSCIIPKMLRQLANEGIGYKKDYDEFNTPEDWKRYLLNTATSFDVLHNRLDYKYDDNPTPEQLQKEVDDAFAKLAHVFYDLWD